MGWSRAGILELHEGCCDMPPIDRALFLIATTGADAAAANALPLGKRNARLLALHDELFGPNLDLSATCPDCGQLVEIQQPIAPLLAAAAGPASAEVRLNRRRFRVRPLTSEDIEAVVQSADPATARRQLAARALSSERGGVSPDQLTEKVLVRVAQRLAEIDPLADPVFLLICPECSASWELPLDVPALLVHEIAETAETVIDQVHDLASCYHWSEPDILRLPEARFAAYLARVRA
jgi:hypothetical protein